MRPDGRREHPTLPSAPNMVLHRTRRLRFRSGRSLRSLGSPLNARLLGLIGVGSTSERRTTCD
jgi:hypothetical protein